MSTKSTQDQAAQNPTTKVAADAVVADKDEQSSLLERVVLIAVGLVLAIALSLWGYHTFVAQDPYVSSVLQMTGNAERGREIFITNCATCHGLEANGEVGPDLSKVSDRKSRKALIVQVISGQTPPMPQFQPNEKDMADLLSFLETL